MSAGTFRMVLKYGRRHVRRQELDFNFAVDGKGNRAVTFPDDSQEEILRNSRKASENGTYGNQCVTRGAGSGIFPVGNILGMDDFCISSNEAFNFLFIMHNLFFLRKNTNLYFSPVIPLFRQRYRLHKEGPYQSKAPTFTDHGPRITITPIVSFRLLK